MSYIKKTNIVNVRSFNDYIKSVRCPYCKTFLEHVPEYVTAMICWNCNKEFRIEEDSDKWEDLRFSDKIGKHVRKRF